VAGRGGRGGEAQTARRAEESALTGPELRIEANPACFDPAWRGWRGSSDPEFGHMADMASSREHPLPSLSPEQIKPNY
jgi:hypothetical protein